MPGQRGARDPHARVRRSGGRLRLFPARNVPLLTAFVLALTTTVVLPSGPAGADAKSDQAEISALGQRIAQDGTKVQQLVASYDQAQLRQAAVTAQLATVHARLTADRRDEARADGVLRRLALNNYMSGASDDSALALFDAGNTNAQESKQEYMRLASANLNNAIDTVNVDKQKTQSAEARLQSAQVQAEADVQKLAEARQAAQSALTSDNALLTQVQGNLQALLAAAAAQRAAAEQQEEKEMAAKAAAEQAAQAAQSTPVSHPATVAFSPTPGSYADPLRAVRGLTPERIDQGVDYSGFGPIYAIGDGVVLSTANSGWPGRHLHRLPPE